jgi:stearoyl-CoA desaturase (delta-9 desaturase)
MRFWLWLTTGMNTKQWVAIHRKHHQVTDVEGDPHSPHVFGIKTVMTTGWYLYNKASKDANFVMQYGKGTPKDWIERKLYTPYTRLGIVLMLAIDLLLFGWWGFLVWGVQMVWIPFWAAGMINGMGHWWGYRNGETKDHSRNISPIGVIVGGEELHNNHHADISNPKFSLKPWEFDIGWMYIKGLEFLGLAKLKG